MRCATRSIRSCGASSERVDRRAPPGVSSAPLLAIRDLHVSFRIGKEGGIVQRVEAVKGVSFEVPENTTVALVGESGSGKSVTAMSTLNLLPENAERSGAITFEGRDLLAASRDQLQGLRGRDIACVFQDPMSSLNPVFTVGQLIEPLVKHLGLGRREAMGARRGARPTVPVT